MFNFERTFKNLICVIMMFSIFSASFTTLVLAESKDTIIFYAGDNTATNVPESIKYGDGKNDYGYGFYSSLYLEFQGSIEKSGWFELVMDFKSPTDTLKISFYIDEVLEKTAELEMTGNHTELVLNNFGSIYLKEGNHTFKIAATYGDGGTEFFKWTLSESLLKVDDVLNFYAKDNAATNVPESIRYGDGSAGVGYGFYSSLYLEYNVSLENGGWYEIDVYFKSPTDSLDLALYIDNVFQKTISLKKSDDASQIIKNNFGDYYLENKDCTFKLLAQNGAGGTEYFKMTLTYKGEDDGKMPLTFIYDAVTTENTYGGNDVRFETNPYNGVVLGLNGSYVEYKVNVFEGNYKLSLCYGAMDSDGLLSLSVNGIEVDKYVLPDNDTFIHTTYYDRDEYYEVGIVSLWQGENTIKISCMANDEGYSMPFSYSSFNLERITEPESKIYSGLEAKEENEILKLKDGTVTVESFFPVYTKGNDVTVFGCIYKNGAIYKLVTKEKDNLSAYDSMVLTFENLELEDEYDYECKVFYWENSDTIKPLCSENVLQRVFKKLYVSPNGSDNGDGSASAPFATLKRAKEEIAKINDAMDGDIIVNVASGTYKLDETEVFKEEHSGKNGYDVIFKGDSSKKPVFSGGTEITGWEKHNEYIWKAPYEGEADIRNLYINGFAAQRARSKYRYLPTVDYNIAGSGNINDGVGIIDVNFPKQLSNPEDIELCWQNAWAFQITPVADIVRENGMVYFVADQPYYNMARSRTFLSTAPGANRRFHIQNAFELLDEPGEFYYNKDEKMIYYYPFKAESLNSIETIVGTTELMFSVSGSNSEDRVTNIVFDNISIKYGAWNEVNEIGMIVDQADKIVDEMYSGTGAGGRMIPAQFDIKNADGIKIKNCEFSCLGSSAIAMSDGVSNSSVTGSQIHDISGSGIVIGHWDHNDNGNHPDYINLTQCSDIDIENNVITRVAYEFKGCIGISVYYEKNINILHNYIKDTAYTGISLGWGWGEETPCDNIKVSYNAIENAVMPPVLDGGHIYTLGALRNSEISYNYFNGTSGEYGAIYPDSGSSYLAIHHNVVEGCNHWFFGGLYETHDINAYANYSDTEKYFDYGATDEYEGENTIEAVNLIDTENRPIEAVAIIEGAGLEEKYVHLTNGLCYPSWRTDFAKKAPSENFVVNDGTWYQAEDFCEGGQGVGYYKLRPKGNNTVYREGDVIMVRQEDDGAIMISDTYPGEWLMYDVEIPYDGTYELTIKGAYVPYTETEAPALVNVYFDDEKIVSDAEISAGESWSIKLSNILGEFEFSEGDHKLKVEFVQMGFAFDCFRIVDVEKRDIPETTSPDYDEGILVIEQ